VREHDDALDCRELSRFEKYWFYKLYYHEQDFWKPLQPMIFALTPSKILENRKKSLI